MLKETFYTLLRWLFDHGVLARWNWNAWFGSLIISTQTSVTYCHWSCWNKSESWERLQQVWEFIVRIASLLSLHCFQFFRPSGMLAVVNSVSRETGQKANRLSNSWRRMCSRNVTGTRSSGISSQISTQKQLTRHLIDNNIKYSFPINQLK